MTLPEVVVALAISALAVGGIVSAYTFCANTAEKSALSMAANNQAMQCLERARAAQWDLSVYPAVDQLVASNFPDLSVVLDLSGSGGATTWATNTTRITQISTSPNLRSVHVDCIWRFKGLLVTNSVETCRAPNQ